MGRIVKADLEGLAIAADTVARGGLICYPTDTVYGLGCDPFNESAVKKAIAAKGKRTKAMPVLVSGITSADRLVLLSRAAKKLADVYWPGQLTMVLPARDQVPSVLAPQRTLGVRYPKHAICQQLLDLCSGCLVGTSANLTGKPPATSATEIIEQLGERVDVILDGGRATMGVASTVVDLTREHLRILREGPISNAEILRSLRERPR
ncbi:MAG TPA: L-threonylcarbamoyladenylate synthase [Candidatus Acidoferrum sp.]|nr:L-threonylcarbamoyladenylate synthase [Candidatus Acidoferrum sp.]